MPLRHERVIVYQRAIEFIAWSNEFMASTNLTGEVRSQLEFAANEIPLKVAEGIGRKSIRERIRFIENAHGAALVSAACLDVALVRQSGFTARIEVGKKIIEEIVNRLAQMLDILEANSYRGASF